MASVAFVQNGTISETATLKDGGGSSLGALTFSGNFTGHSFVTQQFGTTTEITLDAACYAAGTRIATPQGMVAIQDLMVGQEVITAAGAVRPIRWIGHRRVACRAHPRPQDVWPVRIAASAFGPGLPVRELFLSPDHAVFVDGVFIPIRYLLNGATITQEPADEVTYWHVELPQHDVIFAEGLAAESYLDTGNRGAFENGGSGVQLHPDFARRADFALRLWDSEGRAPLVRDGTPLAVVRARLLVRAEALGYALTGDADLRLVVDGRSVRPQIEGRRHRFIVAAAARSLRLVSHRSTPAHTGADSPDYRRLGVAIVHLSIDGRAMALTDPRLTSGWHDVEPSWRWTDGDAGLAVAGVQLLEVEVAMTERYWAKRETSLERVA